MFSNRPLVYYVCIFLCILTIQTEASDSQVNLGTLRFVQTLFRHGDRNPAGTFKTDTQNNESTWRNGFGELSELGIKQQYKLGQSIKRRYENFLSKSYRSQEIHVRSTGYNRTIMSALANLAGMFPPIGADETWNKNLSWQPIPVHSKPREMDPMLWMDKECKAVGDLYKNRITVSPDYLTIERDNRKFFEFLREKTGIHTLNLMGLWGVYDPLYCETLHNDTHKRPDWVDDKVYAKILELYQLSLKFYYNIPEIRRFRGSMLFNDLANRFMAKITNESTYISTLKYFAYSIHDTTQVALLENLQAFDGKIVPYDQALFLELHEENGRFYIKLFKQNQTNSDTVTQINMPICGEPCEAKNFLAMSQKNLPENWELECSGVSPTPKNFTDKNTAIGVLAVLSLVFFVLFILVLALYLKQRKRYSMGLLAE